MNSLDIFNNSISLFILATCMTIDIIRAVKFRTREWMLLFLYHTLIFLSALYYELYALLLGDEAHSGHIYELGCYVSYLFLIILLQYIREKEMDSKRYRSLILIPIFTFAMAVGFIMYSEGDVLSNVICALLMWMLLRETVKGGLYNREKYGKTYTSKWLYRASFIFCYLEYQTWVLSCFFFDDSWTNPYYWSDIMLSISYILFIPAVDRIVKDRVAKADGSSMIQSLKSGG